MSQVKFYAEKLTDVIAALDVAAIENAIDLIRQAWLSDKNIIALGNGGSALTALHYITDWNKSVSIANKRPFRGRTLIDNMGLITAYSNDISYQDVFAEQLRWIMTPGDLVIAISGSGNSENVIRAVDYANDAGGVTLGISGYDGGKLRKKAKHNVWVNCNDMQYCEDVHLVFGHMVMKSLCSAAG